MWHRAASYPGCGLRLSYQPCRSRSAGSSLRARSPCYAGRKAPRTPKCAPAGAIRRCRPRSAKRGRIPRRDRLQFKSAHVFHLGRSHELPVGRRRRCDASMARHSKSRKRCRDDVRGSGCPGTARPILRSRATPPDAPAAGRALALRPSPSGGAQLPGSARAASCRGYGGGGLSGTLSGRSTLKPTEATSSTG